MENKEPLISIVVPVYNVEQYLNECVKSIIDQTYKNIEIILVDDGSKDSSGSICDEYAKIDSRISVIHKENGGLSDARNAGLRNAHGEYVLFVDSDDYITLDATERFCQIINQKGDIDIIIGNGKSEPGSVLRADFDEDIIESVVSGEQYINCALRTGKYLVGSQFNMYRRQYLLSHDLYFEYGILHEDVRFTTTSICLSDKVAFLPGFFYYYRNNPNSIMNRKNYSKNCKDIYDSCLHLEDFLKSKVDQQTFELIMEWLVRQYLGIFRRGKCYQYGKDYIHKDFVKKYAKFKKTKLKVLLFTLSPRIYCNI